VNFKSSKIFKRYGIVGQANQHASAFLIYIAVDVLPRKSL
jgi:hypothetical protein